MAKLAPVATHINVQKFRELGKDFYDQQIFDLLQFGFPLDLDKSNFLPNLAVVNHGSALQFPFEVQAYLDEEIKLGSILGPFEDPPFPDLHCRPLMTAPKDGNKRRIIVDLSYSSAQYHAVNTSVSKTSYVGTPFSLKLPTVDTICHALNLIGKNVKIFKVDLARAFRQLYLDPFDVKYLGLCWKGAYYVDVSVLFGWRNGTLACERVTDTIHYILATKGIFVLNYIDNIVGIAPSDVADNHFSVTIGLFKQLGLFINHSKILPPTSVASCLGIVFHIRLGVLQIPWSKLQEIISLCHHYIGKTSISKQKLQALIGSHIFT
jgi:hypothetical protein